MDRPLHPLAVLLLGTFTMASTCEQKEAPLEPYAPPTATTPDPPPPPTFTLESLAAVSAGGEFGMKHVGLWWGKPPLKTHSFDLALRNKADGPRWILLPETLGETKDTRKGGVFAVEARELQGKGRVIVATGLGNGGFQAMLLPAHAEVKIARFQIESWFEKIPPTIAVEMIIARKVSLGDDPLEAWFEARPEGDVSAAVVDDRFSSTEKWVRTRRHPDDYREFPVTIDEERRVRIMVALTAR